MVLVEAVLVRTKAVWIVLLSNTLMHLVDFGYIEQLLSSNGTLIASSVLVGVTFLSYPFLDWLADVFVSRYSVVKCSPCVSAVGYCFTVAGLCMLVQDKDEHEIAWILVFMGAVLIAIGNGLFESNALQFGLDQLMDSPSDHLSAFIHWFFWAQSFVRVITDFPYVAWLGSYASTASTDYCLSVDDLRDSSRLLMLVFVLGMFLCMCGTFLLLHRNRSHLYIQPTRRNPIKKVYLVLKYAWNHTIPERRSAFTYWESDVPARIDLGKSKYGGPFSNEDVEDTKTFLALLLVIGSQFGMEIDREDYLTIMYLIRSGFCPSISVYLVAAESSTFVLHVTIVIGVPFYRLFLVPFFWRRLPRMMRRMWLGLVCTLIQVSVYFSLTVVASVHRHGDYEKVDYAFARQCFLNRTFSLQNGSCVPPSPSTCADGMFGWVVFAQFLNGLVFLFVFVTTMEFLCAQAPHYIQGMLIGLWYSVSSLKYLFVGIGYELQADSMSFTVLSGVKVAMVMVSLVMYSCVSKRYRYRERDEAVNFQVMIEDQYEREIERALFHNRQEERHLFASLEGENSGYQSFHSRSAMQ